VILSLIHVHEKFPFPSLIANPSCSADAAKKRSRSPSSSMSPLETV